MAFPEADNQTTSEAQQRADMDGLCFDWCTDQCIHKKSDSVQALPPQQQPCCLSSLGEHCVHLHWLNDTDIIPKTVANQEPTVPTTADIPATLLMVDTPTSPTIADVADIPATLSIVDILNHAAHFNDDPIQIITSTSTTDAADLETSIQSPVAATIIPSGIIPVCTDVALDQLLTLENLWLEESEMFI